MKPNEVTDWNKQWRDVEFYDDVSIIGIYRGRSAANYMVQSNISNARYTIFISDMLDMIINGDVKGNSIIGNFKVSKKGSNFGIKLKLTPNNLRIESKPGISIYPVPSYI